MNQELKTAVLLVNLGTPDSPSTSDVRKYLREFLMDPRVIDIPFINRFLLVNLIIAPLRGPRSAKLYKTIWNIKGSPLLYYTQQQAELLQSALGTKYQVEFAMRYQSPSLASVLEKIKKPIYKEIVVLPLFPQYASASTGSVHEKIMDIVSGWQVIPEIRFINSFCDHPGFIDTFAQIGKEYAPENFDHILFSFHGLPERQITKADAFGECLTAHCCDQLTEKNAHCYKAQCYQTARKLAESLSLPEERYTICFQSRLGKSPWIKPYSDNVIRERAAKGDKKILAFAPAFTSDCLETIHEIGVEYNELFQEHGGELLKLVPSLNDDAGWIRAMKEMVL
jgi:ferrochelatase